MPVKVSAVANCDDVTLFWLIAAPIKGCFGFAVERQQRVEGGIQSDYLDNRMGFAADEPRPGDFRASTEWPFQRFSWTDHSVNEHDEVRYRVVPMTRTDGRLRQLLSESSSWTPWLVLSSDGGGKYSAVFNRGLVISQFMARYLEDLRRKRGLPSLKAAAKAFKAELPRHELPIRKFLSGALGIEMLRLLDDAKKKKGHVFAALYELSDDELIERLERFGPNGHVVLANGSNQAGEDESTVDARKRDQNKHARSRLRKKKLEVVDRMTAPSPLAHNKFLVVTDSKKKPLAVWTGSTNWSTTGLCTQINTGLAIKDRALARIYLDQWQRLKAAGSGFPPELATENSRPKKLRVAGSSCTVWFTRTRDSVDLAAIDAALKDAKKGILFLMFQPGGRASLGSIRKLITEAATPELYIKGVVSTLPREDEFEHATVKIVGGGKQRGFGMDVVQPVGNRAPFASWAATLSRGDFLTRQGGVIGNAIIHSKVIVIDPMTKPVIIIGSHNFSKSASRSNDENFLIIRGQSKLARDYAAHILAVYQHYRWLQFVDAKQRSGTNPKGLLEENDTWQQDKLDGALRELRFWVR
jgi:phosphatidylserine/phosphatidylglycerophosphate/cardiolipin synthase-like enzyme